MEDIRGLSYTLYYIIFSQNNIMIVIIFTSLQYSQVSFNEW
jgi:hypothetical protein